MLEFMAGVILTSKLCPREMESTVYAVLAGFQNFGQVRRKKKDKGRKKEREGTEKEREIK